MRQLGGPVRAGKRGPSVRQVEAVRLPPVVVPVSPHAFVLRAHVTWRREALPPPSVVVTATLTAALPVPVGPVISPSFFSLSGSLHVTPLSPELVPTPAIQLVIAVGHLLNRDLCWGTVEKSGGMRL